MILWVYLLSEFVASTKIATVTDLQLLTMEMNSDNYTECVL